MKYKKLRNFLIKISTGFLIILLIVGGGYYMLSDWDDSLVDEIAGLKAKIATAEINTKTTEKQVNGSQEAIDYYQVFSTSDSGNTQNYRRDYARSTLMRLRDNDSIVDLKFIMEPFNKEIGSSDKLAVAMYSSKMTVQFAANTDLDAYNLLRDISQSFPGNVQIKSYKLNRSLDLTDSTLLAIGEGHLPQGLVRGEFAFDWQSIQDNPDYKSPDDKAAVAKPDMPTGPGNQTSAFAAPRNSTPAPAAASTALPQPPLPTATPKIPLLTVTPQIQTDE